MILLIFSVLVIFVGIVGTVLKKNLILKMLSLGIMNTGVVTFFVALSSKSGKEAPIFSKSMELHQGYADPIPQAVIITSIVIGFAVLTFALVYIMILTSRHSTMDVRRIEEENDED